MEDHAKKERYVYRSAGWMPRYICEKCKLFKQNRISIGNELVDGIALDIAVAFEILSTVIATATTTCCHALLLISQW